MAGNMNRRPDASLMLGQRRRSCPSIKLALGRRVDRVRGNVLEYVVSPHHKIPHIDLRVVCSICSGLSALSRWRNVFYAQNLLFRFKIKKMILKHQAFFYFYIQLQCPYKLSGNPQYTSSLTSYLTHGPAGEHSQWDGQREDSLLLPCDLHLSRLRCFWSKKSSWNLTKLVSKLEYLNTRLVECATCFKYTFKAFKYFLRLWCTYEFVWWDHHGAAITLQCCIVRRVI